MKARDFYKKIRIIYFRHLIWPIFPILVSVMLLMILPFNEIINPLKVNSVEEALEAVNNGHKYLEISTSRLIYSGYNYMRDTDVHGEYYYELVDGDKCVFFLMKPTPEEDGNINLYNVTKRVKVEKTNGIFDNMLNMFADTIGWTEEGVNEITEDYILSEVDYHYRTYFVIMILLLAMLAYGMLIFVYNLIFALLPRFSPKLLVAKYYFKEKKSYNMNGFVEFVAKEMEEAKICQGNMYITEHFFVNMDKTDIDIVPINKIVLAYEHSTLKSFLGMHLKVTYTLHLKCSRLFRFFAQKKSIDDVNSILDYFRENEPDILIGYTSENKQLAKKSTSWFRR